ncbi:FAD-binding oxidoreductase [Dactylosporangium fulvum]|uniref:FAD-binding oxidoreductase n=1 Tax=Dactylosporangium fulvum TaxID=53359 RepID=A0ABY5W1J4_9ACTN|nr:FAD-binding oxidoreductase [Dactylosporangium fulvum]UWP83807.1 FAD-binding oxidoreductase [Dactylosporangium fulvum]
MGGTYRWREKSWWGWGWADEGLDDAACRELAERALRPWMPIDGSVLPIPFDPLLDPPRLIPPSMMAEAFAADSMARAAHTYGKSFRDVVRALHGDLRHPPDLICYPRTTHDIVAALDWAEAVGAAVVPYGGGTSVVGGVEYRGEGPWISLDLSRLNRIAEIDEVNHAVRVRVVTPQGPVESLRVPASGAGPSVAGLFLGSEGTLGVIVEAWLRVTRRPERKSSAGVRFDVYGEGVAAVREIVQAGLRPSNCRLLDPVEAMLTAGATDGRARLLLGFEGPYDRLLDDALEICRSHGGVTDEVQDGTFRDTFLRAPYTRDALIRLGLVVETVETACTWSRFEQLHEAVIAAAQAAAPARVAVVTCRFTHVYPDGPAPYFTIVTPARRGAEVAIWDEIKAAVSAAIVDSGGTITHHHAVGRDHRPWYDDERPPLFAEALRAAKRTLDPRGVLNPGVLI